MGEEYTAIRSSNCVTETVVSESELATVPVTTLAPETSTSHINKIDAKLKRSAAVAILKLSKLIARMTSSIARQPNCVTTVVPGSDLTAFPVMKLAPGGTSITKIGAKLKPCAAVIVLNLKPTAQAILSLNKNQHTIRPTALFDMVPEMNLSNNSLMHPSRPGANLMKNSKLSDMMLANKSPDSELKMSKRLTPSAVMTIKKLAKAPSIAPSCCRAEDTSHPFEAKGQTVGPNYYKYQRMQTPLPVPRTNKLTTIELLYKTKASLCNAISLQDHWLGRPRRVKKNGMDPGEENSRVASTKLVIRSAPAGGQAPFHSSSLRRLDGDNLVEDTGGMKERRDNNGNNNVVTAMTRQAVAASDATAALRTKEIFMSMVSSAGNGDTSGKENRDINGNNNTVEKYRGKASTTSGTSKYNPVQKVSCSMSDGMAIRNGALVGTCHLFWLTNPGKIPRCLLMRIRYVLEDGRLGRASYGSRIPSRARCFSMLQYCMASPRKACVGTDNGEYTLRELSPRAAALVGFHWDSDGKERTYPPTTVSAQKCWTPTIDNHGDFLSLTFNV